MNDLPDDLVEDVIVHRNDGQYNDNYYLQRWQSSRFDGRILLSPSLIEGVDLPTTTVAGRS